MSRPLADAWAKYKRADAHADALYREVRAVAHRKLARITHDGEPETGDHVFRMQLLEEPPMQELGLTIGDILHNLHSALDALAWQLVVVHNRGTEPTDEIARSIYFPFARSPEAFPSFAVLKYVTCAHRAMLNEVQPYQRGYGSLLTLSRLSKRDKHCAIHPTYLVNEDFTLDAEAIRDCEILRVIHAPPGPFEDGRELARVQIRPTGPEPETEGKANLTGKVALSDGTFPQNLMDDMGKAVGRVLRLFEPTLSTVIL